ncbi:MAG: hypothetical protein EXR79_13180 [Myxococcales bacterium]|nr:hypothetical protein [Myxococcales bacterium]
MQVVIVLGVALLAGCRPADVRAPVALAIVPELAPRDDLWRIHFIDVGQGLAVLHEFPCGAVLVDTGGELDERFDSTAALQAYLDAFFARRTDLHGTLDLLALTHPHLDHTRGVALVLARYAVRNAIDDGLTTGSGAEGQVALQRWVQQQQGKVGYRAILRDDVVDAHGLTDTVIDPVRCDGIDPRIVALWGQVAQDPGWPGVRYGKTPFQNANNHSVVLRLSYGRAAMLHTGDLEEPAIRDLLARSGPTGALDVDVYQVGHHGSINGTLPELVAAMTPELAVFSCGPPEWQVMWSAWKFGHPRQEVVAMLQAGIARRRRPIDVLVGVRSQTFTAQRVDAALYASAWDGTVVVEAEADGRMRVVTAGRRWPGGRVHGAPASP